MSPRIDVVIPTRGREHLLRRILVPLLEDPAVGRVVLVDDSDPPGSDAVRDAVAGFSERIEVIATGGVGPARARQAGAEHAQAELLLFLDDDVLPDAGLASRHVASQDQATALLVCGYTPVVPCSGARLSGEAEVYGGAYEDRCAQYDGDRRTVLTHLWGGNFSLRRADALRVGLASARFAEHCHEDRDFGLRCLSANVTAVFDRRLCAGHRYERRWPQMGLDAYRHGYSVVLLHELHAVVIGPFDRRQFERNLPQPVAWLVRTAAERPGGRAVDGVLHGLRRVGARLQLRGLELGAIRLLRRIAAARGARAALVERARGSDG